MAEHQIPEYKAITLQCNYTTFSPTDPCMKLFKSFEQQPNNGAQVSDQQCMQLHPVGERILTGSEGKLTKFLSYDSDDTEHKVK